MRFPCRSFAVAMALAVGLVIESLAEAQDYAPRGLFGPRTVGGPIAPGQRDRFSRGIQRSPSGSILSLQRDRYAYPHIEPLYAEPAPPTIVIVPVVPLPQTRVQSVQSPRYVRPLPSARTPAPRQTRPTPAPDTWFRSR